MASGATPAQTLAAKAPLWAGIRARAAPLQRRFSTVARARRGYGGLELPWWNQAGNSTSGWPAPRQAVRPQAALQQHSEKDAHVKSNHRIPFGADFMTSQWTAKFLGLSCRTLSRYRQKNVGPPYYRIGNRLIRYRVRDVGAWALTQYVGHGTRKRDA